MPSKRTKAESVRLMLLSMGSDGKTYLIDLGMWRETRCFYIQGKPRRAGERRRPRHEVGVIRDVFGDPSVIFAGEPGDADHWRRKLLPEYIRIKKEEVKRLNHELYRAVLCAQVASMELESMGEELPKSPDGFNGRRKLNTASVPEKE